MGAVIVEVEQPNGEQTGSLGLFGTGVLCDNLEQALTLVTCSYEWESARNVVVAVRKAEVPVD